MNEEMIIGFQDKKFGNWVSMEKNPWTTIVRIWMEGTYLLGVEVLFFNGNDKETAEMEWKRLSRLDERILACPSLGISRWWWVIVYKNWRSLYIKSLTGNLRNALKDFYLLCMVWDKIQSNWILLFNVFRYFYLIPNICRGQVLACSSYQCQTELKNCAKQCL